ncbi:MAG: cysteine--tRNA ligase [Candidatus Colwellbacteria bacterium]|nr:cysteine--tRNA ligase [Candidatus Colwellbacteria bacterium]
MLQLWNTLSGKKEDFVPMDKRMVRIYTCGPTVYDFAHIGNLRTYIFEDVLRRTLKYSGYKVRQVMNITDIDDKIIKRANLEKKDIREITAPYTTAFKADMRKLNIEKPEVMPKATAHIKDMISLIQEILESDLAYKGEDGSVYFNISLFKDYGKLSKIDHKNLKTGARVDADEYEKDDARDFVLWKSRKPNEPFWKSPFGPGRPGWHIECSAMSMKYLGPSFDIHTGAVDNIFPHHENEIAQSEVATGKPLSRFWIHAEHLLVDGKKMAKSAGNFYTLRDIEKKGYSPIVFRYLVLTTHYRSKLNFSWDSLESAKNGLDNLIGEIERILSSARDSKGRYNNENTTLVKYENKFRDCLEDDLGTPGCLAVLWEIVKDRELPSANKIKLIRKLDKVLGLGLSQIKTGRIPKKVEILLKKREKARLDKDFRLADTLRERIEESGYKIEDTAEGPAAMKIKNE